MKNIKYLYALAFVALLFFGSACTEDFEEMNTNPNLPVSVPLANHLAGTIVSFDGGNMVISDGMITISTRYVGGRWGAAYNPTNITTFQSFTSSGWAGYYTNLIDLNDIIAKATEQEAWNMVAAALTCRAEMTQIYTDRFGEMPYSEAAKAGEGILRPKFDDQQSIYKEIIKDLKTAADYFKAGHKDPIGSVDPLFGGNVGLWTKFCNSLRLRVAIRISNVDQAGATAIISEVLGNPAAYPITQSFKDAAEVTYGGEGTPWTIGYWYWMNLLEHSGPTSYLVDMLENNNDPRLGHIIGKAPSPGPGGEYHGTTEIGRHPDNTIPQMSYFNKDYYLVNNTTGPNIHLRHSETCFTLAEIYLRGLYAGGDAAAKQAYEAGIYSSMKELSIMGPAQPNLIRTATPAIGDAAIATYIANQPFATWGGSNDEKLKKIWNQKWLAMCFMHNEPWAEMRRTDTPNWGIARLSYYTGHNRDPFRLPYPAEEERMNSENSKTYFERQKAGDFLWGGQLWWDKRTGVQ
jgi:hypothetical protein